MRSGNFEQNDRRIQTYLTTLVAVLVGAGYLFSLYGRWQLLALFCVGVLIGRWWALLFAALLVVANLYFIPLVTTGALPPTTEDALTFDFTLLLFAVSVVAVGVAFRKAFAAMTEG